VSIESEFVDVQAIKVVSVNQIEDAFSKALEVITGNLYKINISKLVVDEMQNTSHIELKITSPSPF
jgi:hypothetical protein